MTHSRCMIHSRCEVRHQVDKHQNTITSKNIVPCVNNMTLAKASSSRGVIGRPPMKSMRHRAESEPSIVRGKAHQVIYVNISVIATLALLINTRRCVARQHEVIEQNSIYCSAAHRAKHSVHHHMHSTSSTKAKTTDLSICLACARRRWLKRLLMC